MRVAATLKIRKITIAATELPILMKSGTVMSLGSPHTISQYIFLRIQQSMMAGLPS